MSAIALPSELPLYCDVSLPVPMDQAYTYRLPETLRHRVRVGCRVVVPFGKRQLAGVVLAAHSEEPEHKTREALQLLDEEPALDPAMLKLGRWIASYYCAPLGETLRAMLVAYVVPVIDRCYPLGELPEAMHYLASRHARGKVVITMEHPGQ